MSKHIEQRPLISKHSHLVRWCQTSVSACKKYKTFPKITEKNGFFFLEGYLLYDKIFSDLGNTVSHRKTCTILIKHVYYFMSKLINLLNYPMKLKFTVALKRLDLKKIYIKSRKNAHTHANTEWDTQTSRKPSL